MKSMMLKLGMLRRGDLFVLFILFISFFLHGLSLIISSYPDKKQRNERELTQVPTIELIEHNSSLENKRAFSSSFAITPTLSNETGEAVEDKVESLLDYSPKLVAVYRIADTLKAKVMTVKDGQTEFHNLSIGDELFGFKLAQLTLRTASFNGPDEATLELKMFIDNDASK
ncbi:hypothetical protein K0I73_12250 [Shewanella mesophila]|uniref:hypothetical protein n=1 Tax=Shewanella mesophila TaxID=2864208 RepID=UPI001C65B9ED|nr:hypothetical protein [Shewanella mesophila]QYJ84999.1 hypothetical protein K0I73_12250 [Shewanella mesophila]